MICPKCGSDDIRTSKHSHWGDFLQRARGRHALRCRKCRLRFFVTTLTDAAGKDVLVSKHKPRSTKLLSPRTRSRLMKRLVVVAIFAFAFVLFWFFLRYLTTERAPSEGSGIVSSHLTCIPS